MAPRTNCQACCPSCGLHFAGNSAFDAHLSEDGHRHPLEARTKAGAPRLVIKTTTGACRMVAGQSRAPVTIWQLAGIPPSFA